MTPGQLQRCSQLARLDKLITPSIRAVSAPLGAGIGKRAFTMHKILKRCLPILSISTLLLLAACVNDTPYADSYSHIIVWVEGPGHVTMETELDGSLQCTADMLCGYSNEIQAGEIIPIVAIPDAGHEFTGWTRERGSKWSQDLNDNANPLHLPADGDYWITANFQ